MRLVLSRHKSPPNLKSALWATTKTWLKATCVAIIFVSKSFSKSKPFLKGKDFGMSQYSETLCAMCSILTLISCDWGYIFQDFGYTIDAKPVKNVNENVTHI